MRGGRRDQRRTRAEGLHWCACPKLRRPLERIGLAAVECSEGQCAWPGGLIGDLGSSRMQANLGKRVLMVASGGGHWIQIQRIRTAFEQMHIASVSVLPGYAAEAAPGPFYLVTDMSRFDPLRMAVLIPQLLWILARERPDAVVTTGAAPGLVAIVLAKVFFRARTVWIDSIANCECMSASGRMARRFADHWLTQWPHLASEGGPTYSGSVL